MGAAKAVGGAISKGAKDVLGGASLDYVFGGDLAEKAGLGKYKPGQIDINESAFTDNTRSNNLVAELEKQKLASAQRTAPQATAAQLGSAATMTAAQLGPAATMTPAQLAQAERVRGEQLSAQNEQFRGQQQGLADALTMQSQGQGPSLAASQLNDARNQQIQTAMALAASQRGLTAGQGLRSIADQTQAANQFAASEAAKLRIAEQLAARQQLSGVLQGARGQDIDVAATQAGLNQQANLANQQAGNQFAMQQGLMNQDAASANQQALNQFALQQGGFNQQAGLANQDALNQFSLQQAGFNQQTGLANQAANLQMTGLNQDFANALNQQISGLTMGQQSSLMDLEKMKIAKALEQQALEAGAFKDQSGRMTGFLGGVGTGIAQSSLGSSMGMGTNVAGGK